MDIYQEIILDHYKHPRNYGELLGAHCHRAENPSCGDSVEFFLNIQDSIIQQASFIGSGCAISQAAASLLSEKITGMPIGVVQKFSKDDILSLLGVSLGPTRLKCALLGLEAVQKIVLENRGKAVPSF